MDLILYVSIIFVSFRIGLQGMGGNSAAAAAANAAHLMQFNPLYVQMYQLQMAQAALGKKSCKYLYNKIIKYFV